MQNVAKITIFRLYPASYDSFARLEPDYTMSLFPDTPKKIKARIRSYERKLQKEKEEHNFVNDGYGKRYLLGPLYMLMDDIEGALQSYAWFE